MSRWRSSCLAGLRLTTTPLAALGMLLLVGADPASARALRFSGYDFEVREAGKGGPGPNNWDPDNVWLDSLGRLHLRLSKRGGKWFAAEVRTRQRLGFGRYEFHVIGPIDSLDRNVVLGLFNYPTADVGPDGTNEIDIEFARWGRRRNRPGNFTVWPATPSEEPRGKSFSVRLETGRSRHSFAWRSSTVTFEALAEKIGGGYEVVTSWTFRPPRPVTQIGREPEPVHINLWAFRGDPPTDDREVEIVIERFEFTPLR